MDARRGVLGQVYACAALSAAGTMTGLVLVCGEAQWHVRTLQAAFGHVGVCLALGVVAGLWLPRFVIKTYLARTNPAAVETQRSETRVGFEFAASLAGLLLLVVAVLWGVVGGFALRWEAYRGWLVEGLMFPAAGRQVLLVVPLWLGVVLVGFFGTLVLAALHGWLRLVSEPHGAVVRLWLAMLAAAVVAAGVAVLLGDGRMLLVVTVVASFAAAGAAVLRKAPGRARADLELPTRAVLREVAGPLVGAGLVAAAAAAALLQSCGVQAGGLGALAGYFGHVAGAWLVGVVLARWVSGWVSKPPVLVALGTLLTAAAWGSVAIVAEAPQGVGSLGVVGPQALAAATVVWAGQSATGALGRVQTATAWVGTVVAGGFALGLLLTLLMAGLVPAGTYTLLGSLVLTAVAAWVLIFEPRPALGLKALGLVGVGVWLVVAMGFSRTLHFERPARVAPGRAVVPPVARGWLDAVRLDAVCLPLGGRGAGAVGVDLGAGRHDVIVVTAADDAVVAGGDAARLLERVRRRLVAGGRLVLVNPPAALAEAALRGCPGPGYCLRAPSGNGDRLLLVGADVSAWVAYQAVDAAGLRLEAVERADDWVRLTRGDGTKLAQD